MSRAWGVDERITEQIRKDEEFLAAKAKADAEEAKAEAERLASEVGNAVKETGEAAGQDAEQIATDSEDGVKKIVEWFKQLPPEIRKKLSKMK